MFRCLECNLIYKVKPQYCECGNDTFEEFVPEGSSNTSIKSCFKDFRKRWESKTREEKTLTSAKTFFIICIILALFVLLFAGNAASKPTSTSNKKADSIEKTSPVKIPNIDRIWDSTPPVVPNTMGLPISAGSPRQSYLNSRLNRLDSGSKDYFISLGQSFAKTWPKEGIKGNGTCEMEFAVDSAGVVLNKGIYKPSHNHSLDESIIAMDKNVLRTASPPVSYRGETVIIAFTVNDGDYKVSYPAI